MGNIWDTKITEEEHNKNHAYDPAGDLNRNRKACGLPSSVALCKWILAVNTLNYGTVSDKVMKAAYKTLSKY